MILLNRERKLIVGSAFLLCFLYLDWSLLKGIFSNILPYPFVYGVILLMGMSMDLASPNFKKISLRLGWAVKILFALLFFSLLFRGTINHIVINLVDSYYPIMVFYMHIKMIIKLILLGISLLTLPSVLKWISNKHPKEQIQSTSSIVNHKHYYFVGLMLLFLFFLLIRLYFIFMYQGNYPDDWYHIISGLFYADNGKLPVINQYFGDSGYLRGLYVSLSVSLFSKIVGREIDLLQLVPLFVGAINFLSFYRLLKRVVYEPLVRYAVLFIYCILPFTIFNHIYIRMYVFYEMFILMNLNLLANLLEALQRRRNIKATKNLFALILINILVYLSSSDTASLIVYAVTGLYALYICIFELGKGALSGFNNRFLDLFSKLDLKGKSLYLLLPIIPLILYLTLNSGIDTNPGGIGNGFSTYLSENFLLLTPVLVLSMSWIDKEKNYLNRIFTICGILMLFLIYILPSEINLIRGLVVLTPLLLLPVGVGIEKLSSIIPKFKELSIVLVLLMVTVLTLKSYPSTFLSIGPNIPGEVAYNEYSKVFDYAMKEKSDYEYIHSVYNVIPQIYWNLDRGYVINIDNIVEGRYFPKGIKYINSVEEFKEITKKGNVCIVLMNYSKQVLLNEETVDYIEEEYVLELEASGISLICN